MDWRMSDEQGDPTCGGCLIVSICLCLMAAVFTACVIALKVYWR